MSKGTFVTAVTCMDGRVQRPLTAWMLKAFTADYVDIITEPGPDALLAGTFRGPINAIHRRVQLSVKAHGSRVVAVVAHHDCASNQVPKAQHLAWLEQAASVVRSWNLSVKIVTLWIGETWTVELIDEAG